MIATNTYHFMHLKLNFFRFLGLSLPPHLRRLAALHGHSSTLPSHYNFFQLPIHLKDWNSEMC